MRKFRFLDNKKYKYGWKINPEKGHIYSLEQINAMRGFSYPTDLISVTTWDDWEEILNFKF